MEKNELTLERLDSEHRELQFNSFSNKTALNLGLRLQGIAEEKDLVITIDITRNRQQLFHFASEGTSSDNDEWIKRKNNMVYRFGKSSFYMKHFFEIKGLDSIGMFKLDPHDHALAGGSFPIIIQGTGTIGTITVSGLPDEEDHKLVTSVIREFI